jgi:hypothetical protein
MRGAYQSFRKDAWTGQTFVRLLILILLSQAHSSALFSLVEGMGFSLSLLRSSLLFVSLDLATDFL